MSQQIINVGPQPNDGQGDDLRLAFEKVNNNFSQIWSAGPVDTNIVIQGSTISTTDTNGNLYLSPNGIGNIVLNNNTQPRANNLYYLGQSDRRFRGLFVGTGGIAVAGDISAGGNLNVSNINLGSSLSVSGNIQSGAFFIGDGSMLTNLPAGNYSNANVAAFLPTNTANVSANYFIGDGGLLANLPAGNYSNANVAAYLPTYTGNIQAQYYYGDGSHLTNLPIGNYSNANVSAYLPTYTGAIGGNIHFGQGSAGIVTGVTLNQYIKLAPGDTRIADDTGDVEIWASGKTWAFNADGNITLPTNSASINYANGQPYGGGGPGNYGNSNVAAYLSSGTVTTNISTTANVSGGNLVGGNIYIGNTILTRTLTVGTRITPVTVPLATNNSFNVRTRAAGNVVVYTT